MPRIEASLGDLMTGFRLLRAFNDERVTALAGSKVRIGPRALPWFDSPSLIDRLMRELIHERALPVKEIAEACEFFAVTRNDVRADVVVDLCSGHGLAGLLHGVFRREMKEIVLCDRRQPRRFAHVLRAVTKAAPWIAGKAHYVEGSLARAQAGLAAGSAVIGVHACGTLTDTCLEIGTELGGPVAVLPCCRANALNRAPGALRRALGEDVAYDVQRTYELEERGYAVRWREIPEAITPMNRVLVAVPRKTLQPDAPARQGERSSPSPGIPRTAFA